MPKENLERQLRLTLPLQVRTAQRQAEDGSQVDEMIVEGYAFKYGIETVLWRSQSGYEYREIIDKGALEGADIKDVPLKYNHSNENFIFARTRNGSLELKDDETGLFIRARIIDTQQGRDLFKMIQEGLIDKMSFAFTEKEYADEYGENFTRTRIVKFDKIWDVSAVDVPAYDDTEIYARSIAHLEKRTQPILERKERAKSMRARLRIKLLLEEQQS